MLKICAGRNPGQHRDLRFGKAMCRIIERVKSARIESHGDGHIRSVKARAGNTELAAARHLDRRKILSRQVNGKPFGAQYPLATANP